MRLMFRWQAVQNTPTDYSKFVIKVIPRMHRVATTDAAAPSNDTTGTPSTSTSTSQNIIDQKVLRHCINLSSSYLVTDVTLNPERGISTWFTGFNRLMDIVCALHARGELELETMNIASKACSECWSIGGCWKGLEEARDCVKEVATRLKKLLDENGKTYKGERIYAP
ncbi:hypothetical protein PC9H_005420 [Pleurotus ostreatus]|uniref:Uncharacterized protein n=2 Tax=Pleurotus ostreatus TaxID=5322 RepID=A0A8H7A0F7_PLEOS|nr:uncharacterized protein PC9H_005420 [Pleurotus ostreatus]KAF7433468.1 hypothetical protein PC9H_005420 [Pleurotus ostreatus]